jgi:peroxiredoxin
MVDLAHLPGRRTVIYCYPMTGVPGKPLPDGWDMIPGARGCTPQSCGFRDHQHELTQLGAHVFGLSTQTTDYQKEMAERLHLTFEILSDAKFELCEALRLPSFDVAGMRLIKRLTLVIRDGKIETVFYPVFPPNASAEQVLDWLERNPLLGVLALAEEYDKERSAALIKEARDIMAHLKDETEKLKTQMERVFEGGEDEEIEKAADEVSILEGVVPRKVSWRLFR